jgi:hypothetical protein
MISVTDREYVETKRIKQGLKQLEAPFDVLSSWIESTWHVHVLNVVFDPSSPLHGPRIQVILESERDLCVFQPEVNFDADKQAAIKAKYLELLRGASASLDDEKGLFVVFSAFAPLARQEADARIRDEEVEALRQSIGDPDLWKIARCFSRVTFFFHTDEQARRGERDGRLAAYSRCYLELLKPHDEFGYIVADRFSVDFDSKENFDQNYAGSWFYYYR